MPLYTLKVNGHAHRVQAEADTPLLYVLRNELGLGGPKFGCGLGQCGACTVHLEGTATRSCLLPVSTLQGKAITTLEGLATGDKLHPVQQALVDEQAVQCGYCANGIIMTSAALLARNRRPSEDEVRNELAGNLCRCGTQHRVVKAVLRAARTLA